MPPRYIAVPFTGGGSVLPIPDPVLTATTSSGTQINLSVAYAGPPGAVTYVFERSSSGAGPFSPLSSGTSPNFSDTGLLFSTTYFYRARVQVTDGRFSNFSTVKSATTLASVPGQPTGVVATATGTTTVQVTWNAVAQATGYNVYRDGVFIAPDPASPFNDSGLSPSTLYSYQIAATNASGEGSLSTPATATTAASGTAAINWNPGHYVTVTNGSSFSGVTTINSEIDFVNARDLTKVVKGYEITFTLAQCEGAFGNYTTWFNNVQQVLTHVQGFNPPRTLGIAINCTGNAGGGSAPAYMIDNATYGPVGGTPGGAGAHGGQYISGTTPIIRYDNAATCDRIAAAGTALYNQFGTQIFSFNPLFSEVQDMQTIVPGMTGTNITAKLIGSTGLYAKLRAGMPKTYLKFSPSSLLQPDLVNLYNMTDTYAISVGVYDGTNDSQVAGGTNPTRTAATSAFKGGSYGAGPTYTFTPGAPGLRDRRASIGGQDWHSFTNADELANRSATAAVPPAHHGDGKLPIVFGGDVNMQTSHKYWLSQRSVGPPCNQIGTHAGQPANYAGATWGDLLGFMAITAIPTTTYPFNWPTTP